MCYVQEVLSNKYIDVLNITESKLDDSFTSALFKIDNFRCFRKDRDAKGGGIICYVRSDIPHRRREELEFEEQNSGIQSLVLECSIKKIKWLLLTVYKPPKTNDSLLCTLITKFSDQALKESSDIIICGDTNVNMLGPNRLHDVCEIYGYKNGITSPTCFKSKKGTLIDPILVTKHNAISEYINTPCNLSDFHNLVGLCAQVTLPKIQPKKIVYRSYKNFNEHAFKKDIENAPFQVGSIYDDIDDKYEYFIKLVTAIVNEHAPIKCKYIKNVQVPYMNSVLRKMMFKRNMARNRYFKYRNNTCWNAYRILRNK